MPRNRALSSFSALFAIPPHSFFFFFHSILSLSRFLPLLSLSISLSLSLLFFNADIPHSICNTVLNQSINHLVSYHTAARESGFASHTSLFFLVLTVSLHIYTYTYNISKNNIAHFFCFSIHLYCLFFLVRQISQSVTHRSTITTSSTKIYIKVRLACEAKCIIIRTIV